MRPHRVAVICSMVEEGWYSMDIVADMLLSNLASHHAGTIEAERIAPPMASRFRRLPYIGGDRTALNADRLINRFWDYPRHLRRRAGNFDLFHLVEQSYGQLGRELPSERMVVTCHDLENFRPVLEPERDPRPAWYRRMVERQLTAVRTAARVICVSHTVRDELLQYRLSPPDRVVVIPNGTHPSCSADPSPDADREAARLLGPGGEGFIDLLHVGSTVPRKRIDVLLRVFAELQAESSQMRLIRVGGPFTPAQQRLAERLGVGDSIVVLPFLDRDVLSAVYRRAALVLQPSDAEGFGLPVTEAMACGTPVVASDIPVLREVGGSAATYCQVANVAEWSQAILELLTERRQQPERWAERRGASTARGRMFSWQEHTRRVVEVYHQVLEEAAVPTAGGRTRNASPPLQT